MHGFLSLLDWLNVCFAIWRRRKIEHDLREQTSFSLLIALPVNQVMKPERMWSGGFKITSPFSTEAYNNTLLTHRFRPIQQRKHANEDERPISFSNYRLVLLQFAKNVSLSFKQKSHRNQSTVLFFGGCKRGNKHLLQTTNFFSISQWRNGALIFLQFFYSLMQ